MCSSPQGDAEEIGKNYRVNHNVVRSDLSYPQLKFFEANIS